MALNQDDELLLRSFVYTGYVNAEVVHGHPGKMRLSLTTRGLAYFSELSNERRPPGIGLETGGGPHSRRSTDGERD
jgi:hypothetical protein